MTLTAAISQEPQGEVKNERVDPARAYFARGADPNAILGLIAAGATAVVGLWWHDTPAISGLGDWLTNAGRITGLLAGYSVVVLLALMARVPALERGLGSDRLARWHSMGGRYTVSLSVAHAVLIIWGYSLTDHHNVIGEVGVLWTQYADVLMATVALFLFVGVGITSARAARKRLRYETWLYIHFYTYLAIALTFSHQFSTGADFVNNRSARVVWAAMYIAVAALIVWYRMLGPLRNMLRHDLRVAAVYRESHDTTTLVITGKHLHKMRTQSGQFFRWRFLTRNHWWSANPYSLSSTPNSSELRVTVKHFGDHSSTLVSIPLGTRVAAEGPYGAMTAAHITKPQALLIAGGTGITPLRALFEALSASGGSRVTLIYRVSKVEDILFKAELDAMAERYGSKVIYSIGSRRSNNNIVRAGVLEQYVPGLRECDVYVCGPKGLMDEAVATVKAVGVKRRHIHYEDFTF